MAIIFTFRIINKLYAVEYDILHVNTYFGILKIIKAIRLLMLCDVCPCSR